ncbi:hypothetical protein IAR50_007610 [Cryptococcus sp. DSM 104548]
MGHLDLRELNALIHLADRGGIGTAIANTDCVAEEPDQLMFIKGDHLVLLRDLGEVLLASCEGVVGWARKGDLDGVRLASGSAAPSPAPNEPGPASNLEEGLPTTMLTAPSPPPAHVEHFTQPLQATIAGLGLEGPAREDVRPDSGTSGPFELESDSPQPSPGLSSKDGEGGFYPPPRPPKSKFRQSPAGKEKVREEGGEGGEGRKERLGSVASSSEGGSEAYEGIGGYMMGGGLSSKEGNVHSLPTPNRANTPPTPSILLPSRSSSPDLLAHRPSSSEDYESDRSWDIYGDYARESMYGPLGNIARHSARMAAGAGETLGLPKGKPRRWSSGTGSGGDEGEESGSEAVDEVTARGRTWAALQGDQESKEHTPEGERGDLYPSPITPSGFDIKEPPMTATELRLKLLNEDSSSRVSSPIPDAEWVNPSEPDHSITASIDSFHTAPHTSEEGPESRGGTVVPSEYSHQAPEMTKSSSEGSQILLASPLPIEDLHSLSGHSSQSDQFPTPRVSSTPRHPNFSPNHSPYYSPHLSPNPSPHASPVPPWAPGSPSSPHSVDATRTALVKSRDSKRDGKRPRGLTLVGRMDNDLRAANGPVPITFLVNGEGFPIPPPLPTPSTALPGPGTSGREGIGLGLPGQGQSLGERRASSPLASPQNVKSPKPPTRSVTAPITPIQTPTPQPGTYHAKQSHSQPTSRTQSRQAAGIDEELQSPKAPAARPRSRSFSSSVARTLGVGRKASTPSALSISSANEHGSLPSPLPQPQSATLKKSFRSKSSLAPTLQSSPPHSPAKSTLSRASNNNDSVLSLPLPPPSASSSTSFSFPSKSSKGARKTSRALPSPVSHKDFLEETVKADGMDFELVQPKKPLFSPTSPSFESDLTSGGGSGDEGPKAVQGSIRSGTSAGGGLKVMAETDEWGFLKDRSPTPEIFMSRNAASEYRAIEGKWLSIISTPLNGAQPPKKVRKFVIESGVPNSLRGRVWAWFMAGTLSARVPGLYGELLEHDKGLEDDRIERDVVNAYPDHSIFADPNSAGQQDLRSILRAYSNFAPAGYRREMSLIAGCLLIHCVAEDSFWLLSGLVNSVLKDFYGEGQVGLGVEAEVFAKLLGEKDSKLAKAFREIGLHPREYLDKWFGQLFIRHLPWPTVLRVIDAVVCEGTRFLLVASLTILTLSRDRLLRLPQDHDSVLEYLHHLPQDSLVLPGNFMKACEGVRYEEKEYRKTRAAVEKELMR